MPKTKRLLVGALALSALTSGCQKFESWLFQRYSPTVDRAISAIESRDAGDAHRLLAEYLSTGRCKEGALGTPDSIRDLPNASVDLGLALFTLAERYGQKFGEPLPPAEQQGEQTGPELAKRSQEVDCAQRLVRVIAQDKKLPVHLRAQAYYLSGNLDFLRHDYEAAVKSYEAALELVPAGSADAGDDVGERAAYNRAIAKKRAEEQEKEPPDPPDGGTPPPSDGGTDSNQDEQENQDEQNEQEQEQDPEEKQDEEQKPPEERENQQEQEQQQDPSEQEEAQQPKDPGSSGNPAPSAAPSGNAPTPARPSLSQDEQMLELLERAPMIQQELPKARGRVIGRSSMEDK